MIRGDELTMLTGAQGLVEQVQACLESEPIDDFDNLQLIIEAHSRLIRANSNLMDVLMEQLEDMKEEIHGRRDRETDH